MKNVHFGVRDRDTAMLYFNVWWSESETSLICLPCPYAVNLIEKHQVSDIQKLDGKPCWIDVDGNTVKFVDLANFK